MTEVLNINDLKLIPITSLTIEGDLVNVKCHSILTDGGGGVFMWREGSEFTLLGRYQNDNGGTIIQPYQTLPLPQGKWVRQYVGHINVLYFRALGQGGNYNTEIQAAIDFAAINAQNNPLLKGSTVFIPNGSYVLSDIILRSGVDVIGESISNTNIYTTEGEGTNEDYLFKIESGPVFLNIANLNIIGEYTNKEGDTIQTKKGCFYIEAQPNVNPSDPLEHGGLWYSTFKNILIRKFRKDGIYFKGGSGNYTAVLNQFNILENVRVFKHNNTDFEYFSNALKMKGQNGQFTFINCQFDGYRYRASTDYEMYKYDKWFNVVIENDGYITSNVVTFLNCTFQDSDYGILINYAENITIDNCWFENLGVAIMVQGDKEISKSINILNNRFANALGFGSLPADFNIKIGQCVSVQNSVVSIYNNYVTASTPQKVNPKSAFVLGFPDNVGINLYANTFRDNSHLLRKTFGVMQTINIADGLIDCKSNKLIFVNYDPLSDNIIKSIVSSLNAGEFLTIRANGGVIKFLDGNNLFLTNRTDFSINNGEIAIFIKIDIGTNNETFQLVSFVKTTP